MYRVIIGKDSFFIWNIATQQVEYSFCDKEELYKKMAELMK